MHLHHHNKTEQIEHNQSHTSEVRIKFRAVPQTNMQTEGIARRRSNASIVSNGSSATDSTVSFKQHHNLRAECVKLKVELAKIISISKDQVRQDHTIKNELESLRKKSRLLSRENELLKEKLNKLTGKGYHDSQEVVGNLKHLKTTLTAKAALDPEHVVKVIEEIRVSTVHSLNQAAAEKHDIELELQLMTEQRNNWKFEAEELAIEMNEMKQHHIETEKAKKRMDVERDEWRSIVEQLGVELNETKREKEEMVSSMSRKEAEMMDMMNQLNHDMNSAVKQKNNEAMELVKYKNIYPKEDGNPSSLTPIQDRGSVCENPGRAFIQPAGTPKAMGASQHKRADILGTKLAKGMFEKNSQRSKNIRPVRQSLMARAG